MGLHSLERGLDGVAELLWKSLPPERTRRLIDDLMDWVSVCQPDVTSTMLESTRRKLKREEEPTMMALARMGIEYPRRLRAEGRAEGLVQQRALLLRLATRKFDPDLRESLEPLLAAVDDAARLADSGRLDH